MQDSQARRIEAPMKRAARKQGMNANGAMRD